MDSTSIRPRGPGEILDGAFRLYREDVGLYLATALLASLPWAFFSVAAVGGSDAMAVLAVLLMPVAMVLTAAAWGALMHQMNERLDGRVPAFGPALQRGVRLFFRIAWGTILAYVVVVAAFMLVMVVPGVIASLIVAFEPGGVLLIAGMLVTFALGIVLLVVVGFRAFAGAALFLPGIIVEGLPAYSSLKRGFALSRGAKARGRVVGVVALSWVLVFVPFLATYFVTGTTATLYDPEALASGLVSSGQFAAQQVLAMITAGFTTPFLVACILLLYYDQRVRLEAYDLEAEAEALAE